MGSGKSTVAQIIGKKLGWRTCDLDLLITEKAGMTIPRSLPKKARRTSAVWRELLATVLQGERQVVATGGAVLDRKPPDNEGKRRRGLPPAEIKELCRRLGTGKAGPYLPG